jgi:hypothetical protein
MAGLKSFSVFGEVGLPGMTPALAKLKAFDTAGKKAGTTTDALVAKQAKLAKGLKFTALAIGVVGAASAIHFARFDNEMTKSLAIMGDVSDMMQGRMVEAARKMAKETTHSVSDMARAYFYLASAGLSVEAQIASLPTVARFAQAGDFGEHDVVFEVFRFDGVLSGPFAGD